MDKLQIGDHTEETFSYTQEEVIAFANITGDFNPLHLDAAFAAQTIFKKPIMHGLLSSTIFSRIFGTSFPGNGTVYLSQNLQFVRPMFVDTAYRAFIEITEIDREKHQATCSTRIKDPRGKLVIEGQAVVMNLNRI